MNDMQQYFANLSMSPDLPPAHQQFLFELRDVHGFVPKVCYDIGACVLHWTHGAKRVWPDSKYVLFDALDHVSFLYQGYDAYVGVLSDKDDRIVRFYQNEYLPTGSSYYREIGNQMSAQVFPDHAYQIKYAKTLDAVVKERGFPLPDLVKIDVQGSELDVINGGLETLKHAKYLIVELQHTDYNQGAPKADVSLPYIESLGFQCISKKFADNGADADYCFKNTRL